MTLDLDMFGDVIRAARERRGLRAIDVAMAMNWSGTAPVYRYERGGPDAPRATPDTINQLANVLKINYSSRMVLLGLAGHLPETEPLSPDEESRLRTLLQPRLAASSYPVLAFDFRGRILLVNAALARELGQVATVGERWYQDDRTVIDLMWDEEMGMTRRVAMVDAARRFQLLRFMLANETRRHERWYRDLPARFEHYPGFAEMWLALSCLRDADAGAGDLAPLANEPVPIRLPGGDIAEYDVAQQAVQGTGGLVSLLVMMRRA